MIESVLPVYNRTDIAFDHGEGPWLVTGDGRRFLDFASGVAVNSLGHAHPHLVKTLTEQAQKLWHTSNLYHISGQEKLAQRLVAASFADTVFFTNSGSESIECAIKMARKYHTHRGKADCFEIITLKNAFHGRTLAALAATGRENYLEGFGPVSPGFVQVPFADMAALESVMTSATAGVLLEPIQGEGGVRPVPSDMLRKIRGLCDERGVLLIVDEVQSGMGRTGKLFAYEWADIEPDIVATAKGIGGGFPMGACLATEAAASGMTAGTHGSTFGGNPLAMAVGNAVLDVLLEPGFLEKVVSTGLRLRQSVAMISDQYPEIIEGIQGEGLFLGLRCQCPNVGLVQALYNERVLSVGAANNTVRLLPPLIIDESHVEELISRMTKACKVLKAQNSA